jgi:hypothetical protein
MPVTHISTSARGQQTLYYLVRAQPLRVLCPIEVHYVLHPFQLEGMNRTNTALRGSN